MKDVCFFRFPDKQIFPAKCRKWVNACKQENFTLDNVARFMYICSKHFHDGKGPSSDYPEPISPTASELLVRKFAKPVRQRNSVCRELNFPSEMNAAEPLEKMVRTVN